MLTWLRSRSRTGKTATALYGSIVTQARERAIYVHGGVPDTMEGRFGVIVVHMFLILERIRGEGAKGDGMARALLETFMTDMDDSMREIGIGDMAVPRRVKKAAAALHEQIECYRAAIAETSGTALRAAIERHVLLGSGGGDAPLIAGYIRRAQESLAKQSWTDVREGRVIFPAFSVDS